MFVSDSSGVIDEITALETQARRIAARQAELLAELNQPVEPLMRRFGIPLAALDNDDLRISLVAGGDFGMEKMPESNFAYIVRYDANDPVTGQDSGLHR